MHALFLFSHTSSLLSPSTAPEENLPEIMSGSSSPDLPGSMGTPHGILPAHPRKTVFQAQPCSGREDSGAFVVGRGRRPLRPRPRPRSRPRSRRPAAPPQMRLQMVRPSDARQDQPAALMSAAAPQMES